MNKYIKISIIKNELINLRSICVTVKKLGKRAYITNDIENFLTSR